MNSGRVLFQLMWADFLERIRQYSFLVVLGLMIVVAYFFIPPLDTSYIIIDLDGYRGVYNSAWIGATVAMLTGAYMALASFYVVKGAINRDRETGVGQIIATTPISKTFYVFGKWLSNLAVLTAMVVILVIAAAVMQLVRNEALPIQIWPLVAPFLIIVLPTMSIVAALAVLFDTIPLLRGGFGNILYFFIFLIFFFPAAIGASFVIENMEQGAIATVPGNSGASACCFILESNAMLLMEREFGQQQTFVWEGMNWSPVNLLIHAGFVVVAIGIVLLSAVLFKRFDPAYERVGDGQGRLTGLQKRVLRLLGLEKDQTTEDEVIELGEIAAVQLTPLDSSATGFRFGAILSAELRLMLKGLPWWWYVIALGLIIAGLLAPKDAVTSFVLPIAWIWPILIWSSMGVREARYHTQGYVFSAAYPLRRQLPATWLAGWILAILIGSGVLVRLILEGQWPNVLTWAVGALFIPSLALALGSWSGSSAPLGQTVVHCNPSQTTQAARSASITGASVPSAPAGLGRKIAFVGQADTQQPLR